MKINEVLKEENLLKAYIVESKNQVWKHWTLIEDGSLQNPNGDLLEDCFSLWEIVHELDFREMTERDELERLEKVFKENGYTQEMVEEIKYQYETNNIRDLIENLEEEQSHWGE
ncbi:TPA: hypothetical protein LA742_002251 [Clostridium botulinum]|uniref:hypothetical protein n=1 Tax=Clostridium sporogenes TaxID=1509 RepID=UPI0007740CAC|nr:hypothetical protein [Clostridium sporogenes]AUM93856.1 hypothetical protein RSJ11_01235 [Clostridium sporogenes]HBJ2613777.1 hypothetical protein [Clostridium botulinum]